MATHAANAELKALKGIYQSLLQTFRSATPEEAREAGAASMTYPFNLARRTGLREVIHCLQDFLRTPKLVIVVDVGNGHVEVWRNR